MVALWGGFELGGWEGGFTIFGCPLCCGLPRPLRVCGILGGCDSRGCCPMGQGCNTPGALVAFMAPFLTLITMNHPSTLVYRQGINLNSSKLVEGSLVLHCGIEIRSNSSILKTIIIFGNLLSHGGS